MSQPNKGRCAWCLRVFRQGFAEHLGKHRACAILARATFAPEPEVSYAASVIRAWADTLADPKWAAAHGLD